MRVLTDCREACEALERCGVESEFRESVRRQSFPPDAAVLVVGEEGWERLRVWRVGGWHVPCVVMGLTEPPADRLRLEPVVAVTRPESVPQALTWLDRGRPMDRLAFSDGELSFELRTLRGPERTVQLSELQVSILAYLAARSSRPVPTEELLRQVWGYAPKVRSNAHAMAISRIRKLIDRSGATGLTIASSRHYGYRLQVQAARAHDLVGRDATVVEWRLALLETRRLWVHGQPGCGRSALCREVLPAERTRWVPRGPVLTTLASCLDGRLLPADTLESFVERTTVPCDVLVFDDCDALADTDLARVDKLFARFHPDLQIVFIRVRPFAGGRGLPPLTLDESRSLYARLTDVEISDDVLAKLHGSPAIIILAARRACFLGAEALAANIETRSDPGAAIVAKTLKSLGSDVAFSWSVFSLVNTEVPFVQLESLLGPEAYAHAETFASWGLASVQDRILVANPVAAALGRSNPESVAIGQAADWLIERARLAEQSLEGRETQATMRELASLRPGLLDVAQRLEGGRWLALMRGVELHDRYRGTWSEREDRARTALQRFRETEHAAQAFLFASMVHYARNPALSAEYAGQARAMLENHRDAGLAAVIHVHQHWVAHGYKEAMTLLNSISTRPFPAWMRLRLRSLELYFQYLSRDISTGTYLDRVIEVAHSLADLNAYHAAARVVATFAHEAGMRCRSDGVDWSRQGLDWLGDHPDGFLNILLATTLGEQLDDVDEAKQVFADAYERVDRIEPSRRPYLDGAYSTFLVTHGQLDEARPYIERAVAREAERGSEIAIFSTLLDLATLEVLAGDLSRASVLTERLRAASPELTVSYLRLHESTLMALMDDWRGAVQCISDSRPPNRLGESQDLRGSVYAWMAHRERLEHDLNERSRAWLGYVVEGDPRPRDIADYVDRIDAVVCDHARQQLDAGHQLGESE